MGYAFIQEVLRVLLQLLDALVLLHRQLPHRVIATHFRLLQLILQLFVNLLLLQQLLLVPLDQLVVLLLGLFQLHLQLLYFQLPSLDGLTQALDLNQGLLLGLELLQVLRVLSRELLQVDLQPKDPLNILKLLFSLCHQLVALLLERLDFLLLPLYSLLLLDVDRSEIVKRGHLLAKLDLDILGSV